MQKSFSVYAVGKHLKNAQKKETNTEKDKEIVDRLDNLRDVDEVREKPKKKNKTKHTYGTTAEPFILKSNTSIKNPKKRTISSKHRGQHRLSKRTITIVSCILATVALLVLLYLLIPPFQDMTPSSFDTKTNVSSKLTEQTTNLVGGGLNG